MFNAEYITSYYATKLPDSESRRYIAIHAKRYAFLLNILSRIRNAIPGPAVSIMDIGPSFLTEQIERAFPNDRVFSLGYCHDKSRGGHLPKQVSLHPDRFIHFDLNNAQYPERWVQAPACSVVILAEVIEHLYTAPSLILRFISDFLKPKGTLLLQTPNAVSLYKRFDMLRGRNPFKMIRENNQNPGHYREYTAKELLSLGNAPPYSVTDLVYSNYFALQPVTYKVLLYRVLQAALGNSFKDGITMTLEKRE